MPRRLHTLPFLAAFAAAPLLATALTFWIGLIPYYALLLGGPIYAAFGLPILTLYLRRHPPMYLPIILLALVSLLGTLPIAVALAWWFDAWDALEALPAFLAMSAMFATLWSATFTLLYRFLIRHFKLERPA